MQGEHKALINIPILFHTLLSTFGQKVHIDQIEKLVMFGITHICAVDGFSGKIVAFATDYRKSVCLQSTTVPGTDPNTGGSQSGPRQGHSYSTLEISAAF